MTAEEQYTKAEDKQEIIEAMIEFAKYHVKLALQSANKKARIVVDPNSYTGNTGSEYPADDIADPESILNAYPLENIK